MITIDQLLQAHLLVITAMTYAAHAAIAIENARLYVQVQHHATELE